MATSDYVVMLRESLQKKVMLLRDIIIRNDEQKEILMDEGTTPDDFQKSVDDKDALVPPIVALDDGFDSIFKKVEREISLSKEKYADEIRRMQALIREISDLSERVMAQERVNADLARAKFSNIRAQIKKMRQSQRVVNNYYSSMMKGNYYDPQFYDSKK